MQRPVYHVCVSAPAADRHKELCEAAVRVSLRAAGQEVKPAQFRSRCMPFDLRFHGGRRKKQTLSPHLNGAFPGCAHPEHK
jgi:hypothetical protein